MDKHRTSVSVVHVAVVVIAVVVVHVVVSFTEVVTTYCCFFALGS